MRVLQGGQQGYFAPIDMSDVDHDVDHDSNWLVATPGPSTTQASQLQSSPVDHLFSGCSRGDLSPALQTPVTPSNLSNTTGLRTGWCTSCFTATHYSTAPALQCHH